MIGYIVDILFLVLFIFNSRYRCLKYHHIELPLPTRNMRAVPPSTQAAVLHTQVHSTTQDVRAVPARTHTQAAAKHTQVILLTPPLVLAMIV